MRKMVKEIVAGLALALVIYLGISGYDIIPFVFLGIAGLAVYWIAKNKGLTGNGAFQKETVIAQKITFADIGGQATAINELKEALDFIKYHQQIKSLGIRPLKGILLTGPPGTGKTLLAKAAACYTDAAFVSTSGSEFIEMYAGVGAQRVRKLFQTARTLAKKAGKNNALIFIDEVEILGGKRGQATNHLEYDQTLNQLLVEMDGLRMDDKVRVLLMAATNRVDMLDPALLRPGRFDRQVKVDLPDKQGRIEILQLHMRNKPLAEDVSVEAIAKDTFGFSGAHLESLTNESAILAMREGVAEISQRHFHEAVDKVMMGEKLDRRPAQAELERVAVHEAGHALMSEWVRPGSVSTLTVTPRGQALGYMRQTPEDDSYLYTKEQLDNQIAVMLAGALAEEIVLGNRSTGAANDYQQAISVADQIVKGGMSTLGVVDLDIVPQGLRHRVVTDILQEQEEKTRECLQGYKEILRHVVSLLLEQEKISGDILRKMIAGEKKAS